MWKTLERDPIVLFGAVIALAVFVPYVVPIFSPEGLETYETLYSDIPLIVVALAALQFRLRRIDQRVERHFWNLWTIGFGFWLALKVMDLFTPVERWGNIRVELVRNSLFVLLYLCIVLALEAKPHLRLERSSRSLHRATEWAGAIVFSLGLLTYFAIIPGVFNKEAYETAIPSVLLYAVLDSYLVVRLISLRRSSAAPRWRTIYAWLLAAAALWMVTDLVETLMWAKALSWEIAQTLLDVLWLPPFAAVVVAARVREHQFPSTADFPARKTAESKGGVLPRRWGGPLVVYAAAFPVVHFSLYTLGVLDATSRPAREVCALVFLVVLTGMALIYQKLLVGESQRLESKLQGARKMEAIGEMAGGVAHDFNNLLTLISGYVELALAKLSRDDPLRDDLELVRQAGVRASSLTHQLLAFSRQPELQPHLLDLNVLVADLGKLLRRTLGEDIELATTLDPDLGRVNADPGQLEQVLVNLAFNARDAMPGGGDLVIETANVELDEAYADDYFSMTPGPYVMLAVTDTGCGMDQETQSRIFEPFFTTKEIGKGWGLGLSTVCGIVKHSGGYIWAHSEPGKGTTFKIQLPRVEEAVETVRRDETLLT